MTAPTPIMLDLFCGAGGAARGYADAGFIVIGVDVNPQPRYPFPFIHGDALQVAAILIAYGLVDAIHASPPCQDHSALAHVVGTHGTGWLLAATRALCIESGLPYVIENVDRADMPGSLVLCGTEFDLKVLTREKGTVWLRRHRRFESNVMLMGAGGCYCASKRGHFIGVYGNGDGGGRGWKGHLGDRRAVMGIDWMNRTELSQAIPPAYTRFIGEQVLAAM